jgi:hypothetical protein
MTELHCVRCAQLLEDDVVAVTDSPIGIIATVTARVPRETRWCICGWTYTRASTQSRTHQPHLTLVEGAA